VICTIFLLKLTVIGKKKNTGVGGNGSHSSGSGTGWDFPSVFSWDWDGKRLKFVMHFGNRR